MWVTAAGRMSCHERFNLAAQLLGRQLPGGLTTGPTTPSKLDTKALRYSDTRISAFACSRPCNPWTQIEGVVAAGSK